MTLLQMQSGLGLLGLALLAWVVGGCRRGVSWRVVAAGLGLQILLAAALLHIPPLRAAFALVGRAVSALAEATKQGTSLVFGYLGGAPLPFAEPFPGAGFILFFQGLPLVLVVGALSALLYHWRAVPAVVTGLSRLLTGAFRLDGATGFAAAANVFVGMVEAPLLIRPFLARLTRSGLFVMMTAGLATISGNMLVVYALILGPVLPDAAGQLLVASLISAPAAVLVALLMMPERDATAVAEAAEAPAPRLYDSGMEALVRGTMDGLQLLLGIMAMLIVFVALVALVNMMLEPLTGTNLQAIAGIVFWPIAIAMGIPAEHAGTVATSLGVKVVVNEFVAYLGLASGGGLGLDERSRLILTYALCGFANIASVGINLAGFSVLVPERRNEIVGMVWKAMMAGFLATCLTASIVGVLPAGLFG